MKYFGRKSKLILVSFLLLLYISPMIFISSYASPAILAEPNINKDFSLSSVGLQSVSGWKTGDGNIVGVHSNTHSDDVSYYSLEAITDPVASHGELYVNVSSWPAGYENYQVHIYAVIRGYRQSGSHEADMWFRFGTGGTLIKYYDDFVDTGYAVIDEIFDISSGDFVAGELILSITCNPNWPNENFRIDFDYLYVEVVKWMEVGEAGFILPISWSPEVQFGYDAFFIFLGLIMIPASTMYLVRGGKKGMSTDKLFYGLVIFALGVGFLIGGIMP